MTPPPRKYADAPGMASRAAETSPPADDSATATVSRRARNRSAMGRASVASAVVTGSTASILRQAEHALADDVALDLAGATRDGVLSRAHHAIVPARRVGDVVARPVDEDAGPEEIPREVGDADPQLGAEQLENRALGSRWLAAKLAREVPKPRVLERFRLDEELGEAL